MRKPKIQPLIPLIRRRRQIVILLLLAHRTPHPLPAAIDQHIEHLGADEEGEIERADADQHLVALPVQRLVLFAVDVGGDDVARLHGHVVQGRGDGARADGAGVARGDCDEDGVDVGVADDEGGYDPAGPGGDVFGDDFEGDEEGEEPDLGAEADEEALVDALGEPGPEEELEDEDGVGGDLGKAFVSRVEGMRNGENVR